MRLRALVSATLLTALAACAVPPQTQAPSVAPGAGLAGSPQAPAVAGMPPDGQVYPTGNTFRLLAVEELPIIGATASSSSTNLPASRAIDGDLATQWVDGGYRNATSWLTVELAATATIASIDIKTGPSPAGTSYDVQVSADGTAWTTARTGLTNTSWNQETKTLPAGTTGKYVRILWKNSTSAPQPHFAIYELTVNGEGAGTTTPSPVTSATPSPVTTASPSAPPPASPTPTPTAPPSSAATKLTPTGVTASSTYAGLTPGRAIDGDLSTQWANGGYREAIASLTLAYGETRRFGTIQIKTGALPAGVTYRVLVSSDGTQWSSASGDLTNTTWNAETKAVSGEGRFLRVQFSNAPNPVARFSVYEVSAFGTTATANQAPALSGLTQSPMKIHSNQSATLRALGSDADGDTLTYSWTAKYGQITGSGEQVGYTWQASYGPFGPENLDEEVTVTATDPQGATVTRTFPVDVYSGSTIPLNATQTFEWDPTKVQTAVFNGDVTVQAGGDFGGYNAVICEYNTAAGRQMALLPPGTTTIAGVTGYMYMYLLRFDSEEINYFGVPDPNITLTMQAGASSVTRAITRDLVFLVGDSVGLELRAPTGRGGSPTPWHLAGGESTAMNGSRPYEGILGIQMIPTGTEETRFVAIYSLAKAGDRLPARGDGPEYSRVLFTDSLGGTGDNQGAWTLYELGYD